MRANGAQAVLSDSYGDELTLAIMETEGAGDLTWVGMREVG